MKLVISLLFTAALASLTTAVQAQSVLELEEQAIQTAAAHCEPSIVRIETVGGVDLIGDVLTGTGPTTGVIVDPEGYIITSSFNFAARPASIIVTLPDEHQYAARVVAEDKSRLLTLLKIDASGLKPLSPAPVKDLQVGQWAIALGRTYDLKFPNISTGIISALNRINGRAVQTDANTSPVNYGGPLVDIQGRCIGVIVPLSPQDKATTAGMEWYDSGIGFAIPYEDVTRVLPRLKSGETLHAGLLGITFDEDNVLAGEPKITSVRPESPADKAGFLPGDVITAVEGVAVPRIPMLRQQLGRFYAEDSISLAVKRGDQTRDLKATLAAELKAWEFAYLGIFSHRPYSDDQAAGCSLRYIDPDSPAGAAGLKADDVLMKVDGEEVTTSGHLEKALRHKRPGETVELQIQRGAELLQKSIVLGSYPDEFSGPLPVEKISARPPDVQVPETGRWNNRLPGDGASFWGLVPEAYNPAHAYGLLIWLHPEGDTMEADLVKALQTAAAERGWIVAGIRAANLSGWTPEEEEVARGVIDWIRERYSIDPLRVVVSGTSAGGTFAARLAYKYRDLIRGAILSEAPLRSPPPPNDPDYRLQFLFVMSSESQLAEPIEGSAKACQGLEFPSALYQVPEGQQLLSAPVVQKLFEWLDALDRL